eukprot:3238513-Pyramimonas_sp.AAC.1
MENVESRMDICFDRIRPFDKPYPAGHGPTDEARYVAVSEKLIGGGDPAGVVEGAWEVAYLEGYE